MWRTKRWSSIQNIFPKSPFPSPCAAHPTLIPSLLCSSMQPTSPRCPHHHGAAPPWGTLWYLRWWQPFPLPAGDPSPPAASPAPAGAAAAGPRSSSGASPPWLQSPSHMLPAKGGGERVGPGAQGRCHGGGEPTRSHTPAGSSAPQAQHGSSASPAMEQDRPHKGQGLSGSRLTPDSSRERDAQGQTWFRGRPSWGMQIYVKKTTKKPFCAPSALFNACFLQPLGGRKMM